MPKVAIIGAGLIGRAWAMIFARADWSLTLTDPAPGVLEEAAEACRTGLLALKAHGRCDEPQAALARIERVRALPVALADAAHVQENEPERLEAKREIFAELGPVMA